MKIVSVILFCLSVTAQAGTENMHFTYQPVEDIATDCTHKQIRDLPDWAIICETPYGKKTFSAHVVVREYPRNGQSTGIEILYWVTAPGDTNTSPRKYSSTSALLSFSGKSKLEDFSFSQGIENDASSLVLGWRRDEAMRAQ